MSNFTQLLNYLETFSSEKKGKVFELYCKWFLENDPRYTAQIKKVWLWKDWPGNWGVEKGIDLIAETHSGQIWAIQAKAYDQDYYITKANLDSFLSESARAQFSFRLFIATTNKLGPNARETISGQEKEVSLCLLDKLEEATLEWPASVEDLKVKVKKEPKNPWPHQQAAIDNILNGFKNSNRGQLYMACGTGKTLVGLWVAQNMKSQNTLVLVPSISLVAQLYAEWAQNRDSIFDFDPIFVCSDLTVHKKEDEVDQLIAQTELGFRITTDAQELLNAMKLNHRPKVIFSTYHSSPVLVEACKLDSSLIFDLAIADEAHRCAGPLKSDFTLIVNEEEIRASKRLFMTATPKIFSDNVKQKTKEVDYEIASMDEEAKFGPVFHKLSFSEAIKNNLLTDYQVIISIMDHSTYREYADKGRFVSINDHETDARTLASQLLVAKGMKEHELSRVISFHNRKSTAKEFIRTFDQAIELLPENERPKITLKETIFGEMLQSERKKILNKLKDSQIDSVGLIANVKCLSEGVDIPALDGVAFIDPKGSEIDIVQAVGRAIRKTPDKKKGTIVIPIFLDKDSAEEIDLSQSCFRVIWKVIKALRAHDDILAEELDNIRLELGKQTYRKPAKLSKIIFDASIAITSEFAEKLEIKIIENIITKCSSNWNYQFGLLKEYRLIHSNKWPAQDEKFPEENKLGEWCSAQRKYYKDKMMEKWKIDAFNEIGFPWNSFDYNWMMQFNYLKEFRQINPDRWLSKGEEFPEGNKLAVWYGRQKYQFKHNFLKDWQKEALLSIGFIGDVFNTRWNRQFTYLKEFRILYPHRWPTAEEEFPKGNKLGGWCQDQRDNYKKGMDQKRIDALESLQFPWVIPDQWETQFAYLKQYRILNMDKWPHLKEEFPKGNKLGVWCSIQRQAFKDNNLGSEKLEKLNEINFPWNVFDEQWDWQYNNLVEFRKINPNRWPMQREEFPLGNKLGSWCDGQKKANKAGLMDPERKKKLNEIGFIFN